MRALVIGAGVIGITTAYNLQKEGYQVTVVDASPRAGDGASNVNAGLLVPGDSTIWPNPRALKQILAAILHPDRGALRIHRAALPRLTNWGIGFLLACRTQAWRANSEASLALSRYSYQQLRRLLDEEGLEIHHQQRGMVFLAGSEAGLQACLDAHAVLAELGEEYRLLSPNDLIDLDPAYSIAADTLAGAVYAPSCGSGDCGAFTRQLSERLAVNDVEFRFNTKVKAILTNGTKVAGIATEYGEIRAETVVVSGGAASSSLIGRHFRLSLVPARGYSVTVPLAHPETAPLVGGVDERTHVAFSRMGNSLRATSTAEIGFGARQPRHENYHDIRSTIDRLFPGACDWDAASYGFGDRPMTPADVPLIGPSRIDGLFVNTGHGHLGWTQACGSARILIDLMKQRTPEIDSSPYRLSA